MGKENPEKAAVRPAGYEALIARYKLEVIPNWHRSFVAVGGLHRISVSSGVTEEIFPAKYWPGETPMDHLEFALKYDGTNLAILARIFQAMPQRELLAHIKSKPTGKYARRLWYFYEFLTGKTLPLKNLTQGNYIDLIDPEEYYATAARPQRRQRINDNLPGDRRFCPMIRRIAALRAFENADLPERCRKVVADYPPELLKRALAYLYTKETKSSFEIEHIKPDLTRTERFVALLQLAHREDFCRKPRLIDLQNRIVDPRFRDPDYRTSQNYVGQTVAWKREKIHYACPKPEDLPDMMDGLLAAHQRMEEGGIPPVAQAAAVAYGFVFLHPFEDGNGRIHRFLIHNILARRQFTPEGVMFPVSASMLKSAADYDESLEEFSRPLMSLVEFSLDDDGRMTVHNDTALWYRFVDMTAQAQALFTFIERTIQTELVEELTFLANYDRTRKAIQEIVDMPDRRIDLLIRTCLQNHGCLSAGKRASHFSALTEEEIRLTEEAVQESYGAAGTSVAGDVGVKRE